MKPIRMNIWEVVRVCLEASKSSFCIFYSILFYSVFKVVAKYLSDFDNLNKHQHISYIVISGPHWRKKGVIFRLQEQSLKIKDFLAYSFLCADTDDNVVHRSIWHLTKTRPSPVTTVLAKTVMWQSSLVPRLIPNLVSLGLFLHIYIMNVLLDLILWKLHLVWTIHVCLRQKLQSHIILLMILHVLYAMWLKHKLSFKGATEAELFCLSRNIRPFPFIITDATCCYTF